MLLVFLVTYAQSPWPGTSSTGRGCFGAGGDRSFSPPSRTALSPQRRQHHRQHGRSYNRPQTITEPTVIAASPRSGASGRSGDGYRTTSQRPELSSSFDCADNTPLPGVCYITYPPTPDLAAAEPLSSSTVSQESGFSGPPAVVNHDDKGTRLARCRRGSPSPEFPPKVEESDEEQRERRGARNEGRTSPGVPRNETGRVDASEVETSRADEPGNKENDIPYPDFPCDRPESQGERGAGGEPATSEISGTNPSVEYDGRSLNQEEEKDEEEKERQPLRQSQAENKDDREDVSAFAAEGARTTTVGGNGGHRAGRRRLRGRRRPRGTSNKILSMMSKEGHPLVVSKGSPTLPGVDEHQRPLFCLAEMHDNMRKNRQATNTEPPA